MPNAAPLREGDPTAVGVYRIVGRLGAGRHGVVYLGQAPDDRLVAVKVLREGVSGDLTRALAAARRVEPFCVAQVLDASTGGRAYIVSEYVEGPSLAQTGRHTGADLQRLAVSTATALTAIHQAGLTHRNFKPADVLLGRDGPRVADFAHPRDTRTPATGFDTGTGSGTRFGTGTGSDRVADASVPVGGGAGMPAYLAPEQLAGSAAGPAADVFAWGCVVAAAATGTPPFGDDSVPAVTGRVMYAEPWLGDLPEPLRSVVHDCLAKDPTARPAMRDVLTRLTAGPRQVRRRPARALLIAASAAVIALSVSAAIIWNASSTGGMGTPQLAAHAGESPTVPPETAGDDTAGDETTEDETTGEGAPRTPATRRATTQPRAKTNRPTTRPRRTATPGPTKTRTTTGPTTGPRATPTPSRVRPNKKAATASFSLAYVRVQGSSKINPDGVTCYTGSMNFGVGIDATKPAAPYSYQWLHDGKVIESGSSRLPSGSRSDYVPSRRMLRPQDGTHRVTFRITAPVVRTESVTFAMCQTRP
ncbi:serine/threonine-protein kinase [Nonomuraea sp. ZG12]|uniref:serine/threonine-protein kinase n=1 Tax=Nonomuraea sp. ZG12 TaxID=3452207 RepID=UPI003F8B4902